MIGVIAQGRLGNQMFQFAFAYAAAKKLNTDFFIYKGYSLNYFQLTENFFKENRKKIKLFSGKNIFKFSELPFSIRELRKPVSYFKRRIILKNIVEWNNTLDEKNYFLKEIKDNKLYSGFFQSEEYFKDTRDDLLQLFELKEEYKSAFRMRKSLYRNKKYIAIHIRRTDYKNFGGDELGSNDMTLPVSYYKNCLSLINEKDQFNIVFVSDDLEFAKNEFGEQSNYFFENNDEITDFQILLNADKIIIANSSFSWWAAWLNTKPEKEVYAPEYYLGFKVNKYYPAGIKVNDWNWISTN